MATYNGNRSSNYPMGTADGSCDEPGKGPHEIAVCMFKESPIRNVPDITDANQGEANTTQSYTRQLRQV
jgi:hypothetical protein